MKEGKIVASRMLAVMLALVLTLGYLSVPTFGAEEVVDNATTSEIAAEEIDEDNASGEQAETDPAEDVYITEDAASTAETSEETAVEDPVSIPSGEAEAPKASYTVTLDANGGYFENEWDDVLEEYVDKTEILNKVIPVGETVSEVPVNKQEDAVVSFLGWSLERGGEIVWQRKETAEMQELVGYAPVDNCVLYAVWMDDDSLRKTEGQIIVDEETDQIDVVQEYEEAETTEETGEEITVKERSGEKESSDAIMSAEGDVIEDTTNINEESSDAIMSAEGDVIEDTTNINEESSDSITAEEGNVTEDTASVSNIDPETERGQAMEDNPDVAFVNEDVANTSDDETDAAVVREEAQPELIESSEEETVREDAAKNVLESGTFGDDLTWTFDGWTLTISGIGDMIAAGSESWSIPWYGYNYRSVIIENGVKSIGPGAFSKSSIKTVSIPPSVKIIWDRAFSNCDELAEINIPYGVESIGAMSFYQCNNLAYIDIPESVKHIGGYAFKGTKWIKNLNNSNGFVIINNILIDDTGNNSSISIPQNVHTIGEMAFAWCDSINTVTSTSNVKRIEEMGFAYCKNMTKILLSNSVREIGVAAFVECVGLENVDIPDNVTSIGDYAFDGCTNLKTITIYSKNTTIGKGILEECAPSLVIYGISGSYAEQYAKDNNITFVPIESSQSNYEVFFDTNGGSNIHLDHYTVTNGTPYGRSVAWTPSRDGHIFTGWYTSKEGGTKITEKTIVNLSEDQTLYAHWKEGTYTVTFDPNGGTISQKTKIYTGSSQYGVFPNVTRDGYELIGWFDAIENGRWIDESDQIKYSDHTLYAYWLPSTITFDPNGGEFRRWTNNLIQYDSEHRRYSKDMPLPVREGYEFVGWYTDKNSGEKMSENDLTEPQRVKQTLYAHWKKFTGFHASRDGWPIGNIEEIFSNNPEDSVAPISAYFSVDRINPKLLVGGVLHSAKANCFGLCLLAVAQYEGKIDIESYTNQSGESLIEFGFDTIVDRDDGKAYSIAGNDRLKTLIQRAQVSQFSHTIGSTVVFKSRRDDFSDIIEYTQRSAANPLIVGMTLNSGKHGVVLETGREVVHNSDGTIGIYCYDPNNPQPNGLSSSWADYYFNPESQIVINQSGHCWCFESYDARERRLVRSEWHEIISGDLVFYDISNLNSNWFFTNDMNFFKRPSGYMTNLLRSTTDYIDIYTTKLIQSQNLPFKLEDELIPADYERFRYMCNNSYSDALDMIVMENGDYVYQLSGESEMVTISDNYAGCVNTNGEAYLVIGDDGIAQIENIGSDKLTFTLDVNCADGDGVVTAEGTLDSGNKIAVAPDDKSDNGYVVVKTDADLDDIHTTININNEVVENDFHEESDNPDETQMSGTYGDAVNWSLSNTGCLTISGTGELNLSDQEDPDQEDQPWYEYKDEINKVVIKDGITKIGDFFFYGYKNLKKVSLPGTVASVGQKTFSNTPIVYLRIPCEDFTLGYWSFYDCTNLKSIYFKGLAKTDKDYDFAVPFQGCTNLTDVTVNSGIIGKSMFRRCTSIKNVKLGSKVTEIGESAFDGCTGISSIDLPNALTIIGDNAFCNTGIEEIFFPESLTSIGHGSFRGTKLKEITFPDSFTTCPAAFSECNELSSIRFGKNMTSIEGGAFFQCNSLTEIVIPDSIQSIESAAFYDCPNLLKVTFGKSLNYLGYEAFASCDKLEEVKLTSNKLLDWENNSFANDTFVLYYPIYNDHTLTAWQYGWQLNEESEDNGSGGITWKSYLAETITGTLGDNLSWAIDTDGNFSITGHGKMEIESASLLCPWKTYKRHIKKVDIQSGITSIGEFAFGGCEQLLEVNIPESVEEIGEDAFRYCRNLKEIDIPDGVTIIDVGAFNTCTSLKKVVLPDGIDCIESSVFEDCSSLTDVYIPNSVTEIWPLAFNRCYALKTLTIPEGVALIGPEAFVDCKGLESIIVHSSKLTIYSRAFVNCSSLKEIHFKSDAPFFSLKSVDSSVIGDEQPNEAFKNDTLTAYYPGGNTTWSEEILKNYGGTITWTPWYNDISKCAINITTKKLVYNGKNQVPEYIVKEGQKALSNNKDYVASFKNNKNAGTATMTITGKGNYAGTKTTTFKIDKAAQSIVASNLSIAYPKTGLIKASGNKGKLSYKSSKTAVATVDATGKVTAKGAGTATITITAAATDNYNIATKQITVTVAKAAQSITAKAAASSIATGKTTTISITGAKGTKSYKSSNTGIATVDSKTGKVTAKKVGTVKITATSAANANYNKASKTVTIKVVPAATSSITVANQATGIKLTWKKVAGATGYKVYRGATLIKTIKKGATVTCTDTKANTNGTKYTFKIVPTASTGNGTAKSLTAYRVARPAISSVKNSASKKMTVKWAKNAKATGYQIQYSTSKTFASGNKTATVTKVATVSKVIGSLTKGKTYYVRIRTYKTVGKTKFWSTWSTVKSVKISK